MDIKNTGGIEGTYTLELKVEGTIEKTREITLKPQSKTTESFTINREETRSYSIEIGNLSRNFSVLELAEFELSDLVVGSSEVEVGEEVEVSVDVENVGEREGSYVVELVVGEDVLSKNVSLGGGESTTVSFVVSRDEADVYDVKVGNLSSSLEFYQTPPSIEYGRSDVSEEYGEKTPKSLYRALNIDKAIFSTENNYILTKIETRGKQTDLTLNESEILTYAIDIDVDSDKESDYSLFLHRKHNQTYLKIIDLENKEIIEPSKINTSYNINESSILFKISKEELGNPKTISFQVISVWKRFNSEDEVIGLCVDYIPANLNIDDPTQWVGPIGIINN